MQVTNKALRINCYVRINKSGFVGRLGSIYRDPETRRRSFGVDWAGEYTWTELTRISPLEFHSTDSALKITPQNGYKA